MKTNRKLIIFIGLLIASFSCFLYFYFKTYNYRKEYIVEGYKISEEYNKKENYYKFLVSKNNITYPFILENKYIRKRELVDDIKILEKEDCLCLLPISKMLDFYPVCNVNNELYAYNLYKDNSYFALKEVNIKKDQYKNIDINYLNNNKYLLYNYKGYYLIDNTDKKELKLFTKDNYTIDLVYKLNNYLLIADYNEEYYFHDFYLINSSNAKVKEITSDFDISFDSIFLGDYKNKIYLLDKKEKKEYLIDIKKEKITEIDFQIIINGKVKKTSYNKIISDNMLFINNNNKYYTLENNILYKKIDDLKIKITNKKVDKIIDYIDKTIYYLSGSELYMYNEYNGEVLLLNNFEWNFNNNNIINIIK